MFETVLPYPVFAAKLKPSFTKQLFGLLSAPSQPPAQQLRFDWPMADIARFTNSHTYLFTSSSLPVEGRPQTSSPSCFVLCCSLPSIFLQLYFKPAVYTSFPDLSSRCSLVSLFLRVLAVPTMVLVWQCCHNFFLACVQASSISSSQLGQHGLLVSFFYNSVGYICDPS